MILPFLCECDVIDFSNLTRPFLRCVTKPSLSPSAWKGTCALMAHPLARLENNLLFVGIGHILAYKTRSMQWVKFDRNLSLKVGWTNFINWGQGFSTFGGQVKLCTVKFVDHITCLKEYRNKDFSGTLCVITFYFTPRFDPSSSDKLNVLRQKLHQDSIQSNPTVQHKPMLRPRGGYAYSI